MPYPVFLRRLDSTFGEVLRIVDDEDSDFIGGFHRVMVALKLAYKWLVEEDEAVFGPFPTTSRVIDEFIAEQGELWYLLDEFSLHFDLPENPDAVEQFLTVCGQLRGFLLGIEDEGNDLQGQLLSYRGAASRLFRLQAIWLELTYGQHEEVEAVMDRSKGAGRPGPA